MNKQGLLSLIVKIDYPKNSLTKEEQVTMDLPFVRYIYFYEKAVSPEVFEDEFKSRMAQAWRPGASAEYFAVNMLHKTSRKAGKLRGEWL